MPDEGEEQGTPAPQSGAVVVYAPVGGLGGAECPACAGSGRIEGDVMAMARAVRIALLSPARGASRNGMVRLMAANKILEEGQLEHLTDQQLQAEHDRILSEMQRRVALRAP